MFASHGGLALQWVDLSAEWPRIVELDEERQTAKKNYKSGLHLSRYSTWLVGLAAEVAISKLTGQPVDEALRPEGDKGQDFICDFGKVDVKGTVYISDPDLVAFPNKRHEADYYQLVAVDVENKRARPVGWASTLDVHNADRHDYGHGERLRLKSEQLIPGVIPSMEWT